jgi:3',5'-cyclic AMP phosphodiesterase CpdA
VTVLLQVSDPHFGTERPEVVQALLALATLQVPDVLVLSGDITQRARRRQFAAARRFVDAIGPRVLLAIPGNHDIPLFNVCARVLWPYAGHKRVFGDDLEPAHEADDLLVLTVNTTRPYRHKHGEVSEAQVRRVAARLRQADPVQLRVVVVHQPVLAARPEDAVNVLRGARHAVVEWAAAGADLVLGGHIHLPYVRSLRTIVPDLARDLWTAQAGTAVSSRVRDGRPNSVNLVRSRGGRRCDVERWDFAAATGRFELHERHEFAFGPGPDDSLTGGPADDRRAGQATQA